MPKRYYYVATVRSMTEGYKAYTIKKDDFGNLSCNCPAWIYNVRKDRTCKHIDYYLTNQKEIREVSRFMLINYERVEIEKSIPKSLGIIERFRLLDM